MVDINALDDSETGIYSIMDCDDSEEPWFTFIVKSTKLGNTSGFSLEKRLQLLINRTPEMMKTAHEAACKDYEVKVARFLAWDPAVAEARYREDLMNHNDRRWLVSSGDLQEYDQMAPRAPKPPVNPEKPVPPVENFDDVSLETRIRWLQYGDFEDAGIEIIEIIAGPPSCTAGHALEVQ